MSPSRTHRVLAALALVGCTQETVFQGKDIQETGGDYVDVPQPDGAEPPTAVCSASPNPASPGDTVVLDGSASFDAGGLPVVAWDWLQKGRPDGSQAVMSRGDAQRTFLPDVVGTYGFTLFVTNDRGKRSPECQVIVDVRPRPALYVEVRSSVSDNLELELTSSAGPPCTPAACTVDWGEPGPLADPYFVFFDEDDGPLIESVAIDQPAAGTYDIAVRDGKQRIGGNGDNDVLLTVYVNGAAVGTATHRFTYEPDTFGTKDAVPLLRVAMPGGTVQPLSPP